MGTERTWVFKNEVTFPEVTFLIEGGIHGLHIENILDLIVANIYVTNSLKSSFVVQTPAIITFEMIVLRLMIHVSACDNISSIEISVANAKCEMEAFSAVAFAPPCDFIVSGPDNYSQIIARAIVFQVGVKMVLNGVCVG